MQKKILIAEDEPAILVNLVDLLSQEGYVVVTATNGVQALEVYERENPDLLILDVSMPEKNGLDVCKEVRRKNSQVKIYMLTAKSQEVDKVVGLEIGADDYIVKPFGVDEFLARIRVAFREKPFEEKEIDDIPINFGKITIDPKTLKGLMGKSEFTVSKREVLLLQLFMKHDGEVIDRSTIFDQVWGSQYFGTTRTLDQHIAQLRKKIEDNPSDPKYIVTVHGAGYRFCSKP